MCFSNKHRQGVGILCIAAHTINLLASLNTILSPIELVFAIVASQFKPIHVLLNMYKLILNEPSTYILNMDKLIHEQETHRD